MNLEEGCSVYVGQKMGFQKTWSCFSTFGLLKLQKKMWLGINIIKLFVFQTRRQYLLYVN